MNLTSCLLMASLGLFLVLILVLSASTTDSFPKTQKKLNESAALICDQPCSGLTQWRRNGAEVAQCGPGAKQGFELTCAGNEGRSTLTVPQVTYSTRGRYSVYCSGREVVFCRQFLQLLTPEFPRELDTGDLLKMDLQISGTARILFTRTGNLSRLQLCSVDGRHHGCLPEYQKRVFIVGNTFILGNTVPSDSGIYTIQEEDGTSVSIWNVTIKGGRSLNAGFSTPEENRDLLSLFAGRLHDVRRIQTCQEGFGKVAGIFGTVMLVIGVFLGVFGVPRVLRLKDRVLQRLRGGDPSGSVENGNVPLKEDLQSNMNPKR
ncbi:uncharacterized protein LOC108414970 isoform X1 [Pygocentrus nattereri]|uniref:uncharacterized protein LOC108414970 isoform X1 n=1 Tax=Pygocentrus nattereri TaxID=42514 RepID=UPI0008148527|nr:uncharacterized protein LOC108414970 isoform X1 [Pygocentrus nattereri]XP_017543395.1 uncharacterized protein LOC108414970 isoform X1 [Pygocentrus nattereri]